ncbi:cohesin domain-containing protein [Salinibacter ruber]|uniref:cohesin domain-containing protein n=1 Tax=Salinibacter ruber TaxID=146919 RepID=UPI002168342D|nr:cohesin domain-containing protein [Salinibacter ruber]MCS4198339.1 hypothetical protein [Salinibacter ruber]
MPQIDTLKPLATLFAALLFAVGLGGAAPAQAQDGSSPTLSVPSVEAEAGSGVDVPVEATDFNNVGAASLTITYDPSVVSFANGADTESPISGAPDGFQANVVEPGELRVNFVDLTGENPINFGTGTLFTVNFGSFEGGTSPVAFGADSQVNDPNGDALGATFEGGSVSGQVGAVTAGTVEGAGLNQTVSVPLSADSIGNVGAASFEVEFDESVLAFEGVSGDESGLGLQGTAEGGVVTVAGTDTDGATLEGEFVDLEFRFLGGSSAVTFAGGSEIVDATSSSTEIATNFSGGEVAGDSPTVSLPGASGVPGDTLTVPVETSEIQDVGSASIVVTFDGNALSFAGSEESLEGFQVGSPESGVVNVSGTSTEGADPSANGGRFANLQFTVESGLDPGETTPVGFDRAASEITNPDAERTLAYNTAFEDGQVQSTQTVPTLSVPSVEAEAGSGVDVPVEATDFNNVGAASLTITYDPSVVSFANGADTESPISGAPDGFQANVVEPGELRVNFFDQTGENPINFGTGTLFTINFGSFEGGTSPVAFGADSQVNDPNRNALGTTFEDGAVSGQVGAVTAGTVEGAGLNQTVSVPLSADSIGNVGAASFEVEFDESVLAFEGVSGDESGLALQGDAEGGVVSIGGTDTDGATLEGEFVDLEFRFLGGSSEVTFAGGSEIVDATSSSTEIATNFSGGEVAGDSPTLSFPDRGVTAGDTISVPVQTTELQAIGSASVVVNFNPASLTFVGSEESLEGFQVGSPESGVVNVSGTSTDGVDPSANESKITSLLFEVGSGFGEGSQTTLGFDAGASELTNPGAERTLSYNVSFEEGRLVGGVRQVALNAQALDLTAGDTELRVEEVTASAGDAVVITTADDDGDGEFGDEEIVGSAPVEEDLDGGEVLVDVEGADPVDHAAHVSTDGTVPGVVATSDRAPVYAVTQFDWQDETSVGPAGTVTVDVVEILYEGSVGQDTISINLHEASGGEIAGEFVGISQEDLAVNETHEEVAVDVIEPISPPAESPQRTESTIAETGEFFAMAHLGPAGTGADGGRVPVGGAQQPPLRTTASPGVIGDFATVTVEAADLNVSVSRDFEEGASDPADYELVAIPGSTGVDVNETVTGDRGTNWRAFLETGGSGGDGSLQSYGDEPFSFRAGRGVWVLAQNGWSFEGTVPAVSAADGTPSVPLQDGWNAISNPLQEDLVWANVRDASGLSEALFRWTGEGGFQPVDTLRSAQENGEAYYTLNNEGADSLELTSSAGPNSTLAANTAAESRSNASPRTVELSATANGKSMTSTVTVGMDPSAEEASSYRAPPAHFGGTALRIRDGDPVKSFMRMVAATDAETSRFDLSLQAEPGTSVEISAGDLPKNAGPGFGVVLVDGGDTYDLRDGPATVTVSENGGSAGFQVRLGDAEKIAQQTAPDKTRLRANYPNPFSEQTTIEYDLAEQSEVNIRVYNVLGQQVATLAQGRKQAGTYKIDWSGQSLSSGKYFVRLEAGGTTDTKQVTVVR